MKKIITITLLLLFVSCQGRLDLFEKIPNEATNPEDSNVNNNIDPDLPNNDPDDTANNPDESEAEPPFTFGLLDSYCYGFSTPPEDKVAEIEIPENFPASYDLSSFLPPVRSQGQQGSCVGWAVGYYLKSFHENLEDFNNGMVDMKNIMSPAYVFNQIKVIPCSSSTIPDALDILTDQGVVPWQVMPYTQFDCRAMPTETLLEIAEDNKITSYSYLDEELVFDQAKAFLLNQQPIVVAISIDAEFFGVKDDNNDAVYRDFNKVDGAHAMMVVGYDDARNAFKLVNSWGTGWGNGGFVWIDYKAFKEANDPDSDFKILCEAWVAVDQIN